MWEVSLNQNWTCPFSKIIELAQNQMAALPGHKQTFHSVQVPGYEVYASSICSKHLEFLREKRKRLSQIGDVVRTLCVRLFTELTGSK